MEGIDFDETYAPVARNESIRMLLAFKCHKGFSLAKVYVKQTPGFEDPINSEYVYKLYKALHELKEAPRA